MPTNLPDPPFEESRIVHPPGFRARRGLNWGCIGLLYTSFYMCRYNFPIANGAIANEFGFTKGQMGTIISSTLLAYACGQILNGLLADRIGGKKAMLIGAAGTIFANVLFGFASFLGTLTTFSIIWGINGYLQSFGAPGRVKMNTAWFPHRERGRFAGIFGFMINLGRFGIVKLGAALLAGFTIVGLMHVGPLHWRWLFWAPSIICALVSVLTVLFVKETPEEAGYHHLPHEDLPADQADEDVRASYGYVLRTILSNPAIWITASAYFCTGVVRQSVDQWFARYMQDVHSLKLDSDKFQWLGFLIPFVASAGSLMSGYVSDVWFNSRRAPVAAGLFFFE